MTSWLVSTGFASEDSGQLGCSQSWGALPRCSLGTFYTILVIPWSCAYVSLFSSKKAFLQVYFVKPKIFLSCCFCVCNVTLPLILTIISIECMAFPHLVFSECTDKWVVIFVSALSQTEGVLLPLAKRLGLSPGVSSPTWLPACVGPTPMFAFHNWFSMLLLVWNFSPEDKGKK